MRARCASLTMVESSLPAETCPMTPSNSEATGLDMPALKRGFCRSIAEKSVDPARGRTEMKWNFRGDGDNRSLPYTQPGAHSSHGSGRALQLSPETRTKLIIVKDKCDMLNKVCR